MTRIALILFVSMLAVACGGSSDKSESGKSSGGAAPKAGASDDSSSEDGGLTLRKKYSADKSTASVTGSVTWDGKAPKRRTIAMGSDKYCDKCATDGDPYKSESTVVGPTGGLANVVVSIKASGLKKWKFGKGSATRNIDQKNCRYVPHVLGVQTGDELHVKNSDSTLHNIHALPAKGGSDWFNKGQPNQGDVFKQKVDTAGVFKMKCEVHGWMTSYIYVVTHPLFAVTGEDGKFNIGNLPAGSYTLVAWHEKHGEKEMNFTVADGESKEVTFTFKKN